MSKDTAPSTEPVLVDDEYYTLLELYCRFGLDDIAEESELSKGKGKEDAPMSDAELARRLWAQDASTVLLTLYDSKIAHSIGKAIDTDQEKLDEFMELEAQAQADRNIALKLSGTRATNSLLSTVAQPSSPSPLSERSDLGASSSRIRGGYVAPPPKATITVRHDCIICRDPILGKAVAVPCGHYYDVDCLTDLISMTIRDETLYPPRCCRQPIPFEEIRAHVRTELWSAFEEISHEFGTVNRLYCSNKSCSVFLGAKRSNPSSIVCTQCGDSTCGTCAAPAHPTGNLCEEDGDVDAKQLLEIAKESGWQRCPGCHQMVELSQGCYHMTCRCQAQFCYLCAATWKTCSCDHWDEHHLMVAAERRIEVQFAEQPPQPAIVRERLVREEVENLRNNHECDHRRWRLRQGAGNCENCGHYLDRYLLRCGQCQMLACVRCQRNRL